MGEDQNDVANERHQTGSRITRRKFLRQSGLVIGAGAAGGLVSSLSSTPASARGGTLRVGIGGGGARDTVDAHRGAGSPDLCRRLQLYNMLATFDHNYVLRMELAEEITATGRPDVWTIRLKKGVEFHDGKSLTADDVIFSLRRVLDPSTLATGRSGLLSVDPNGLKKLDNWTIRAVLNYPDVTLDDTLAQYSYAIVPVGYDPAKPVGTGPFRFQSFTPGQRSVFTKNPNYWQSGLPYVDEVVIFDFPDETARLNALLSDQVDVIDSVGSSQIPVIAARSGLQLLKSPSGQWIPFTMRVDQPPFNDVRVRQAMRLIVDRPQMVKQALAGYGRIANDLFSPYDPAYFHALPQRHQDIDKAKALLKQAGQQNLTVNLQTAPFTTGAVEAAQVFAAQAKAANVTVNIQQLETGVFYGSDYTKYLFALDYYFVRNYLPQVSFGMIPTAPFNETHWPDSANSQYTALYKEAKETVDRQKRTALIHRMQQMEYDSGGLIVWGFVTFVDAYNSRVTGLAPDPGVRLSRYGLKGVSFV
jgi:peptide/nickel transport system substrate-binding protein